MSPALAPPLMPDTFRYLVKKDRPLAADAEAVEDCFNRQELAGRPVVRDELRNLFYVFESREEFLGWQEAIPEAERCFHAVIFGPSNQRLKFDVDAPGSAPVRQSAMVALHPSNRGRRGASKRTSYGTNYETK